MNSAAKTYVRQFIPAMIVYSLAVIGSGLFIRGEHLWAFKLFFALLPVVPMLFALRAYLRYVNAMDELQQRIQLNAVSFAAGATGFITFTYGFLENVGAPLLSWVLIFPLMIVVWGLAVAFYTRRYQ